jgi:hypothetical protein
MNIRVWVEVKREPDETFYNLINKIHSTLTDNLLDELKSAPKPVETGEFQQSWQSHREDVHNTVIYNDTPQARYLQGTGIWGPTQRPFCAIRKEGTMVFNWRADHYRLHVRQCVAGINPERIHGYSFGDTYNFIEEMNSAIRKGIARAKREMEDQGVKVRAS